MRIMLYEAAQSMLVRTAKWSWLKAWATKIARHRGMKKAIGSAGRESWRSALRIASVRGGRL
jgi:transposase